MGFRIRRSVKLPRVRVDIGRRIVSTPIGVREAQVTFGKSGPRATVGLPGMLLSYTHLKRPHRSEGVRPGPPGQPPEPETRRGLVWLVLIVAVVMWWLGYNLR
jgi:hypothetical protein